jgi:hypothetical protein
VVFAVEGFVQRRERGLVIVGAQREVEIFREPAGRTKHEFPQAGTAFEGELIEHAIIPQQTECVRQDDLTLGYELISHAALMSVSVDDLLADHRGLFPNDRVRPRPARASIRRSRGIFSNAPRSVQGSGSAPLSTRGEVHLAGRIDEPQELPARVRRKIDSMEVDKVSEPLNESGFIPPPSELDQRWPRDLRRTLGDDAGNLRKSTGKMWAINGVEKCAFLRRHGHLFAEDFDVAESEEPLLRHGNEDKSQSSNALRSLGNTSCYVGLGKHLLGEAVVRASGAE